MSELLWMIAGIGSGFVIIYLTYLYVSEQIKEIWKWFEHEDLL
jgi:hypothetical protein